MLQYMTQRIVACFIVMTMGLLLGGCGGNLPEIPTELPAIPTLPVSIEDLPGSISDLAELTDILSEVPNLLEDLGLPDISQISNLPDLDSLPILQTEPGTIAYRGPTERRIDVGTRIPGTELELVSIGEEGAEFQIEGFRSVRSAGDSLDFDGEWPGMPGVTYSLRLRIYRVGGDHVRAAGVQQLTISDVQPVVNRESNGDEHSLQFPFVVSASVDELFPGTTYGYVGLDDRGGQIRGLPEGDYPYHKIGDSIRWQGSIRSDISVEYNLRMLLYNESSARVGGTVHVTLPN